MIILQVASAEIQRQHFPKANMSHLEMQLESVPTRTVTQPPKTTDYKMLYNNTEYKNWALPPSSHLPVQQTQTVLVKAEQLSVTGIQLDYYKMADTLQLIL